MLQHNKVYLLVESAISEELYFGKEKQRHFHISLCSSQCERKFCLQKTQNLVTKITFY